MESSDITAKRSEEEKEGSQHGHVHEESLSQLLQTVANRAFEFLSAASSETLCLCALGLGITLYVILGRLGLALIGFIAGVVSHATWNDSFATSASCTGAGSEETKRRKEVGIDVVSRVLSLRERKNEDASQDDEGDAVFGLLDFQPATRSALDELIDAIIRDYVKYWYSPIIPSDYTFPLECRKTLANFILSLSAHLSRRRPVDTFLDFVTNSCSIFIVFLSELSGALMTPECNGLSAAEAVELYLKNNPESHLATVLDSQQQQQKLDTVSDDILHSFLRLEDYKCRPAQVFLRRVLADVILEKTIDSCSKPEWIDEWIIYLLEEHEGDHELMQAIDAGVSGAAASELSDTKAEVKADQTDRVPPPPVESSSPDPARSDHRRAISKADKAMEEALLEAQQLNEMIAAEDALRKKNLEDENNKASLTSTEEPSILAPTSSSDAQQDRPLAQPETAKTAETAENAENAIEHPSSPESLPTHANTIPSSIQVISPMQSPILGPLHLLTLHNAKITVFDDTMAQEKEIMRSKPTGDFLLQIEPESTHYSGWMTVRKYADFENLHEVLRRVSRVSEASVFSEQHANLPHWKGQTKSGFCGDLEQYIGDALTHASLAESDGMKKFLEKDTGQGTSVKNTKIKQNGFRFSGPAVFETMGRGMLDVLANAPKGAAEGGKAFLDGVTGVFGGQKKLLTGGSFPGRPRPVTLSSLPLLRGEGFGISFSRRSQDSSQSSQNSAELTTTSSQSSIRPLTVEDPTSPTKAASECPDHPEAFSQPNGPSIPESISKGTRPSSLAPSTDSLSHEKDLTGSPSPTDISISFDSPSLPKQEANRVDVDIKSGTCSLVQSPDFLSAEFHSDSDMSSPKKPKSDPPMDSDEARVIVELLFAVLSELYNLSSAWNIRRTLLNAVRTFLLRPGNASLETIRSAIQSTVIDANISDVGIAFHLKNVRKNALPTEEELAKWPPPIDEQTKEQRRERARKLLTERGMPMALKSVMGAAASAEALGRVFDCLQSERVARGLMFAILLQGIKALTH